MTDKYIYFTIENYSEPDEWMLLLKPYVTIRPIYFIDDKKYSKANFMIKLVYSLDRKNSVSAKEEFLNIYEVPTIISNQVFSFSSGSVYKLSTIDLKKFPINVSLGHYFFRSL